MSATGPTDYNQLVPSQAVDVNLSSDTDLTQTFAMGYARELYVGTGGTVIATMRDDGGTTHTYKNVASGATLSGKFVTVKSTSNGTTAADIVARA